MGWECSFSERTQNALIVSQDVDMAMLAIHFEEKKKTEKWWRRSKKERRERCQMSSGWHSSKLKNSRHGRLIVLARGCTTILSLSLLLSSPSSSSPLPSFSWVFCYCWDASALQSIWYLEALWNYQLSLCNWLQPVNCLTYIYLTSICHFIYSSSLLSYLSITNSADTAMLPEFLSSV